MITCNQKKEGEDGDREFKETLYICQRTIRGDSKGEAGIFSHAVLQAGPFVRGFGSESVYLEG